MDTPLTAEALHTKVAEAARLLVSVPGFIKTISGVDVPNEVQAHEAAQGWLFDRLAMLGVYKDDESHAILVHDVTEGDARAVMCENGEPNIPVGRFKAVWRTLSHRGVTAVLKEAPQPTGTDVVVEAIRAQRPIAQWSDKELLEAYSPNCQSQVEDELRKRSRGVRCIVFNNDESCEVDVSRSLYFLRESRRRDVPIHDKMGDVLRKVYTVGDFPSQSYVECPVHGDTLLFDGYCDCCAADWKGIPYEVLQFVRVIVDEGEGPTTRRETNQLIRTCRLTDAITELAKDYPTVKLAYDELKQEDRLPSLRRRTSSVLNGGNADPFQPGNRRT